MQRRLGVITGQAVPTNAGLRGLKGRETDLLAAKALAAGLLISAALWAALLAFALYYMV
jgi:hypothetical protein